MTPIESFITESGYHLLFLAIEAGELTYEEVAEVSQKTVEELKEQRDRTIRVVVSETKTELARVRAKKKRPKCTLANVVGLVGWAGGEEGIPLAKVKVTTLHEKSCVGCGGRAGFVRIIESPEARGPGVGREFGPVCLDKIVYEDDPAHAAQIMNIKSRLNARNN